MLATIPRRQLQPAELATLGFPSRESIGRLQSAMQPICSEMPEPEHIFHPGWYERRLLVPSGMLIVGKIHRHEHILGVISGRALVVSEFGRDEVRGGYLGLSPSGVKRVVLAIEDTLFVTIHANPSNTRDLVAIEAEHIVPEALGYAATETLQ